MSDTMKEGSENRSPRSPAEEAIDTARRAWAAAAARCASAHRAALANLDQRTDLGMHELTESSENLAVVDPSSDCGTRLLSRLSHRVLLLAEALQKQGLIHILDAGTAVDAISRDAADVTRVEPPKSSDPPAGGE